VHPGLLAACAEMGQGWNTTPCGVAEFRRRLALVREACAVAGRDAAEIEASVELQVLVAPTDDAVRARLGAMLAQVPVSDPVDPELRAFVAGEREAPPEWLAETTLLGTPDQVREQVTRYVEAGASHFLLWFIDAPDRGGMELFGREVMPAFHPGPIEE
jgi:alkanesulfonate monooxygenase SsuD/methylene tetrahydromethanopterin reductase-like flavin-dependent oxidoreductase (luciferase family)